MTPRQVADAIVCAVLDAAGEHQIPREGERMVRLGDAVLDALEQMGVGLLAYGDVEGDCRRMLKDPLWQRELEMELRLLDALGTVWVNAAFSQADLEAVGARFLEPMLTQALQALRKRSPAKAATEAPSHLVTEEKANG